MMSLVTKVVDPDQCPYCRHTWHGLACADRGFLYGHPDCPCKGSILSSELDALLDTDV